MSELAQSPRAARTRRDIVAAAMTAWATDNSASLGQVAESAGVGRTTVNRYFSDRAQLVAAVDQECRLLFLAAVARARPADGTGLAALQRACSEIVQLGPVLGLIFADNALVDPDTWAPDGDPGALGSLVVRGQADGSIAPDLPAEWVATHVWTSLFAASLMIRSTSLTSSEVGRLLSRTLANGVAG
jgi:AcrR family transcriptional regulator